MGKIVKYAFLNALGTALYIILVSSFVFLMSESAFGGEETIIIPIAMLMLLVFSVALVGSLMFGRPMVWYIDGKKKEALSLLAYTLIIFMILTVVAIGVLVMLMG